MYRRGLCGIQDKYACLQRLQTTTVLTERRVLEEGQVVEVRHAMRKLPRGNAAWLSGQTVRAKPAAKNARSLDEKCNMHGKTPHLFDGKQLDKIVRYDMVHK